MSHVVDQFLRFVCCLGIELTQDLSWSPYIPLRHLCAKARQLTGLLYILTQPLNLLQLYRSFIRPHLAIVWDPHFSKDTEALEKVQWFTLHMCFEDWSLHHNQLYLQSQIPHLTLRWSNTRLEHLFKIILISCVTFEMLPSSEKILSVWTGISISQCMHAANQCTGKNQPIF